MWTKHGYHMDTMWFPGAHHIVSHVDTMWFPCGYHLVFRLKPCGVNVETTWVTPISKIQNQISVQIHSSHLYMSLHV